VIAVDAGHGGTDPGAIAGGTREKGLTLALARDLKEELRSRKGTRVFLVRKGDYLIPLRRRWMLAEQGGADLFVSLHCNWAKRQRVRGTSVYFLSLTAATDEASRELAQRENEVDRASGATAPQENLNQILFDMRQNDVLKKSEYLAALCLQQLSKPRIVSERGVKQAGFAVLKSPRIPSILIEAAFLSNPAERKLLKDRSWRKHFAHRVADGIVAYCKSVASAE